MFLLFKGFFQISPHNSLLIFILLIGALLKDLAKFRTLQDLLERNKPKKGTSGLLLHYHLLFSFRLHLFSICFTGMRKKLKEEDRKSVNNCFIWRSSFISISFSSPNGIIKKSNLSACEG